VLAVKTLSSSLLWKKWLQQSEVLINDDLSALLPKNSSKDSYKQ